MPIERNADGSARKPYQAKEPNCVHYGGEHQPASACNVCKDGSRLRDWAEQWEAWLSENPDSLESSIVRRMDESGKYQPVINQERMNDAEGN